MGAAPVFETTLEVLPSKNFSRDPSVWDYLGGPSPKKFTKKNGWGRLLWGFFPPKISQGIPVFEVILVVPPQKNPPRKMGEAPVFESTTGVLPSKKFLRDPSVWNYLGGPSQKKNPPRKMGEAPDFETTLGVLPSKNFSRDPSVWDYLGGPSQKKIRQEKWVRHQFLRLPWGLFPPKISQEIPVFEIILGVRGSTWASYSCL